MDFSSCVFAAAVVGVSFCVRMCVTELPPDIGQTTRTSFTYIRYLVCLCNGPG